MFLITLEAIIIICMEKLWADLTSKLAWPILNRILNNKELPTGRGALATFQKLNELFEANEDDSRVLILSLKDDLLNAVLFRNKYVKYYDFDAPVINQIVQYVQQEMVNLQASSRSIGLEFPQLDDESVLEEVELDRPELIEIISSNVGYTLIYSTKRKVKTTENITPYIQSQNDIFLSRFTRIFAESVEIKQFFDIVCIDTQRNTFEIRIDDHNEMTIKQLEANCAQIMRQVIALFSGIRGLNFNDRSHNFYSMLHNLWADGGQGKVKEMGFVTDTNSLKHEKEKYTSDIDLRTERYHEQGKNGITLDFYRLAVSWERVYPLRNQIYMAIPGRHYMLNFRGGAFLDTLIIRECYTPEEYYHIIDVTRMYQ